MIRQSVLAGLVTTTNGVITAADTVLTALGKLQAQIPKTNLALIQRTTSPIAVSVTAIAAVGASLLPSVSVTVTGVLLGDFVLASFSDPPPTGLTISAVQATAANTVLVTFASTQALTLANGSRNLNFSWMR